MKLGEILVNRQMIAKKQLEQAIDIQKSTNQKLGKILIDYHFLKPDELEQVLQEQYWHLFH
ncbi:MAG: hypothetical protein AAGD25_35510 [Cyanobacteria bacterium P01_F01_bin.150]